ncbi:MAG TPA: RNA methyltransferase [Patescibacteria group bacterium]|nr:RNA methyltransferase [Patescibacteria group bacterium]
MKRTLFLILPDIRSCHNVGAMFRTADACGFAKIYLVGYTPCPPKPQIDKVSLGAEKWMAWENRQDLPCLLRELRQAGVRVIALEKTAKSVDIKKVRKTKKPLALLVGNEVDGISESIMKLCDQVVHIPMQGRKESLNVSVAAGIAMYMLSQ